MAHSVEFGNGSSGKIRNYWVGLGLAIITFGVYGLFWYYLVNRELQQIGVAKDDPKLAGSSPGVSVLAVSIGGFVLIPPFVSVYNYMARIRRAEELGGLAPERRVSELIGFFLYFFGAFLILPLFVYYWYATKHQNTAVMASGEAADEVAARIAEQPTGWWDIDPKDPGQERWRDGDGTWTGNARTRRNWLPGERESHQALDE
jgi:hypothetical protein